MIPFPDKKYDIIYADPPWSYSDKGCNGNAAEHYPTMTVDEIARLTSMLRTLAIVAFAIGALALIGSVVIWIKLDIKNVIGFLSGKNAAKAIEALLTGKQAYKGKSKGVRPSEHRQTVRGSQCRLRPRAHNSPTGCRPHRAFG